MQSNFHRPRPDIPLSQPNLDERYDFLGLNLVAPDQAMPEGKSPYTINSRRYARNDGDTRVAIHTRRGSINFSTPVGETADALNDGAITDNLEFSADKWVDLEISPDTNGALTMLGLTIKKSVSGNGPAIVELFKNGRKLAQSSIMPNRVINDFDELFVRFIDAPLLDSTENYRLRLRVQANGTGAYHLALTAGTGVLRSTVDDATSWTSEEGSLRYSLHLSPSGEILGYTRRNPQSRNNRTLFAMEGKLYSVPDNPAEPEEIYDGIHAETEKVRFDQVDDKTFFVDGNSPAKWWNGTDTPTEIANAPNNPTHVLIYENRACFVPANDPTAVRFSGLYDFESYRSVDLFYAPSPKSPDHITALTKFQRSMTIFTRKGKHIVYGSSISTFQREEATGTQGAISQEAVAVGRNRIYFMSDDRMVYAWDGNDDELLSREMEPEFQRILNLDKVRLELHRNQLYIYYNTVDNPVVDRVAVYDLIQQEWWMDTGKSVMGSVEFNQDDNQLIEFSSRAGWLFQGDKSYSDLGKAIDFKYWTQYLLYGSGMARDRVKKFRPVVRPAQTPYYLMVGKDIDFRDRPQMSPWLVDAGGATWGNFVWGDGTRYGGGRKLVDEKAPMSGRGKYTQYRFECNDVETPVWLLGYQALIKSGRPR